MRRVRLAAVASGVSIALTGCSLLDPGPSIPIPEGVPPGPGAPVPSVNIHAEGRTALQLTAWATGLSEETRIPLHAMEAYGNAAATIAETNPACTLSWTTLAGLGWVESRHGGHEGASVEADGSVTPAIRGVALNGSPGLALIPDTDGGELDGDAQHDRAMGPFQFIPETWRLYGVDANGDGVASPDTIDDAAVAAGRLLCDKGGDLGTSEGWTTAVWSYNHSDEYVAEVRDAAAAYSVGRTP